MPRSATGVDWNSLLMFFTAAERADLPYEPRRAAQPVPGGREPLEGALTVMRWFEPEGTPRGLIVHLTGVRGFNDERYIPREFLSRGYAVLSVPPPSKALEHDNIDYWHGPAADRAAGLEPVADRLARLADWGMAEWAYAVESALTHISRRHPELADKPTAILGCSMGAIALPAVVSRTPGRYDCAVLVAGGGSLVEVLHEGSATDGTFTLEWADGAFSGDDWSRLDQLCTARSMLDPISAAAFLRPIPVLQLHADFDAIVPARTGEHLYQALGRPERWSYPVGHVGMFVILPTQMDALASWVDSHLPPDPSRAR